MAQAVAIAAETAREAAQQEYNQDDDEYRSKRHGGLPERPRALRKTLPRADQSTIRAASPQVIRRHRHSGARSEPRFDAAHRPGMTTTSSVLRPVHGQH